MNSKKFESWSINQASQINTSKMMQHIFGRLRNPAEEKNQINHQPLICNLYDSQLEQINTTTIRNMNPKISPKLMSGLE